MNVHWCLQEPSGRGRATLSRRHRGDRRPWKGVRKVTYNSPYGTRCPTSRPGPKMPARPAPEVIGCSRRTSRTMRSPGPVLQ